MLKRGCVYIPEPPVWTPYPAARPACGPIVGMHNHDVLIKKASVPLIDKNAGTRRRV